MKIQFLGAAQTVTGSCYMLETLGKRFAVDCGMHQGNKEIEKRNNAGDVYRPKDIDFFCITHAHIDHSGLLPRMVRLGFRGPIYTTSATRDLLEIMLLDSAHIQEMEAEWNSQKHKRRGGKQDEPLYTQADALKTMPLFKTVEYNEPFEPVPGLTLVYKDAGHILGSAFIQMTVASEGQTYRLLFSGDLGRPDQLLLNDPSLADPTDYLFVESTYGDRNHKDVQSSREELAQAIAYSYAHKDKVIIPAFAVERTQEILYTLFLLSKENKLPKDMPVFVDSPLAIRATEIFRKHPEYMDDETQALLQNHEDPLKLPNLRFTLKTEESQALNTMSGPAIIISASGMCNAGRIQHHLRHNLWREGASIVFVGFQAKGTPGRKIVDGAPSVHILGDDVAVKAKVFTIGGFSAHAGQSQILNWLSGFARKDMEVFLVHGEASAQQVLAGLIKERFQLKVHVPAYLEECILRPGKELESVAPPAKAQPRIDWGFVLGEVEAKLGGLQGRLRDLESKPWTDQTEFRDRLVGIAGKISGIISEL